MPQVTIYYRCLKTKNSSNRKGSSPIAEVVKLVVTNSLVF